MGKAKLGCVIVLALHWQKKHVSMTRVSAERLSVVVIKIRWTVTEQRSREFLGLSCDFSCLMYSLAFYIQYFLLT